MKDLASANEKRRINAIKTLISFKRKERMIKIRLLPKSTSVALRCDNPRLSKE